MRDAREAVMDAITALQRVLSVLEGQGEGDGNKPLYVTTGASTIRVQCRCGTIINYGDKYCKGCGREMEW